LAETRCNQRHKLFGHRFAGHPKSPFVDGSDGGYLLAGPVIGLRWLSLLAEVPEPTMWALLV
jgi:hypothetical protein